MNTTRQQPFAVGFGIGFPHLLLLLLLLPLGLACLFVNWVYITSHIFLYKSKRETIETVHTSFTIQLLCSFHFFFV